MLKSNIDIISLLAQVFMKKIEIFLWLSFCDMTVPIFNCLCAWLFPGVISVSYLNIVAFHLQHIRFDGNDIRLITIRLLHHQTS